MIDEFKVTFFKRAMMIVGIIVIFLIGLGFGSMGKKMIIKPQVTQRQLKKLKKVIN